MQSGKTQESETKEITVEEFARLTKENNDLKALLQKASEEKQVLEKHANDLDQEVRKTNSASLVFQSAAQGKQNNLEKIQGELEQTQKKLRVSTAENQTLQAKQKQYVAQMHDSEKKTAMQITATRKLAERFQKANAGLLKQVAEAKQEAAKTPRWKYVLGVGLILSGILLTATGVGGAAGIPMTGLGYAAFSVGTATLVSSFLYAVYKGIRRACCSSSSVKDDAGDSSDMDFSTTSAGSDVPDSSVHDGHNKKAQRQAQDSDDSEEEHKQERRGERTSPSYAGNRHLLLAAPPAPYAPSAATAAAGLTRHSRRH